MSTAFRATRFVRVIPPVSMPKQKDSVPQEADGQETTVPKKGPIDFVRREEVSAGIWVFKSKDGKRAFPSANLERSYVDKTGTRKYTGFFPPESLAKLPNLIPEVLEKMRMHQKDAEATQSDA